jgi:DNA-binding Xre family transcriptional regulator
MIHSQQMPTQVRLKEVLQKHDITIYALQKKTEEQGNRISYQALHALVHNPTPNSVRLKTLDALVAALCSLTGEHITVSDLLEYQEEA